MDYCLSITKTVSLTLIFDYECVCAENYCNLVSHGIFVNKESKTVIILDKYRAVKMFHTLYTKHIK